MSGADITLTLSPTRAATARSSEHSASLTDEEDSSGTGVHLSPADGIGSQESSEHEYPDSAEDYEEDSWTQLSKVDVGPSESASRPSTTGPHRPPETSLRRPSGRHNSHGRLPHRSSRPRRPQPSSSESVESNDELLQGYGPDLPRAPQRRPYHWITSAGQEGHHYPGGYSGQSYASYPPPAAVSAGQQLIALPSQSSQYPYSPYQQHSHANVHGYFGHHHAGVPGSVGAPLPPPTASPYGPPEIMHPSNVAAYYQYPPQPYQITHPMTAPSQVYHPYQPVYTPPPPQPPANATTPAAQADTSKDDSYAELKQMLLNDKADREEREAKARKAEQEKLAALEAAKAKAEEIAKAAEAAAAAATTEAEKKAADEQAKLKAEAEEAAKKAKAEADEAAAKLKEEKEAAVAAAAAAAAPPEEKKKPIKFKDAVGRKFSFPFHLCRTWEGMEDLIRQAFLHVDVIGPHVAEGHYDLIGPGNEIILPGVWETVVEPDWTITMHMWPMPEAAPDEAVIAVPDNPNPQTDEPKKPSRGSRRKGFGFFGPPRPKAKSTKSTAKKT